MDIMHYAGLDIHKKSISFCLKLVDGTVVQEGVLPATRQELDRWLVKLPQPWMAAMEATIFTSWVYDHLRPHAAAVKVAHPLMLRAIAASKRKNDRMDARKIADLLRADLLPECYMAPAATRDLRRQLRYRNVLVRQRTQTKNKVSGLLMETGVVYNKQKLHQKKYFHQLLETAEHLPPSLKPLLELSRTTIETFSKMERSLLQALERDPMMMGRIQHLMTIPAVGPVTALTWALEVAEVSRFTSYKQAVSYCGLCGSESSSAGVAKRTPISKQRNKHLQTALIEAAKLAPRHSLELAKVYEGERQKGNRNRATLAVARKLVRYLLAVDRRQSDFVAQSATPEQAA